jgi:hypothetical protein
MKAPAPVFPNDRARRPDDADTTRRDEQRLLFNAVVASDN